MMTTVVDERPRVRTASQPETLARVPFGFHGGWAPDRITVIE